MIRAWKWGQGEAKGVEFENLVGLQVQKDLEEEPLSWNILSYYFPNWTVQKKSVKPSVGTTGPCGPLPSMLGFSTCLFLGPRLDR